MSMLDFLVLAMWFEQLSEEQRQELREKSGLSGENIRAAFVARENRQDATQFMQNMAGKGGWPGIPTTKSATRVLGEGKYTQEQRREYWQQIEHPPLTAYMVSRTGMPRDPEEEDFLLHAESINAFMEDHDGTEGYPGIPAKKEYTEADMQARGRRGNLLWILLAWFGPSVVLLIIGFVCLLSFLAASVIAAFFGW